MNTPTVLILGANGRFGAAAARAFADAGWRVLAQVRRDAGVRHPRVVPLAVALDDVDALAAAAAGARTVVHAVNPLYTRWDAEALPALRHGLDVAERIGARFMLPGNVYTYGEGMPAVLSPQTPDRPTTRKGRIRQAMEAEMRARTGIESVVIRAGDFYGGGAGSWFDLVVAKSVARGKLVYPGPCDLPHAWAYLPDLARAFVAVAPSRLAERATTLHFAGHAPTGDELLDAIEAAARRLHIGPQRPFARSGMPWGLIRAGGVFVPMWRELATMSYLWRVPHALDGAALAAVAGALPATPLDAAVEAAVAAVAGPAWPRPALA